MNKDAVGPLLPQLFQGGFRLLSLDGCGIHFLSSLFLLRRLMYSIQPNDDVYKLPKPCDYFDLMVGTGIGGLIALMLGRMACTLALIPLVLVPVSAQEYPNYDLFIKEMDMQACIDAYLALLKDIVEPGPTSLTLEEQTFNSAKLQAWLHELCERFLGDPDADLLSNESKCKVFVCTAERETERLVRLRAYNSTARQPASCSVWEAARAAAAIPLMFVPIKFRLGRKCEYIASTGIRSVNPVDQLYLEVTNGRVFQRPLPLGCMISIGIGSQTSAMEIAESQWTKEAAEMTANPDKMAKFFSQAHVEVCGSYFRFQAPPTFKHSNIAPEGQKGILSATMSYLHSDDITDVFEASIGKLCRAGAVMVPGSEFRRPIEQTESMCFLTSDSRFLDNIGDLRAQRCMQGMLRRATMPSFWVCNLLGAHTTGRTSLNLRYLLRDIHGGTYKVYWNFAYIYRVGDWGNLKRKQITCLAGHAVNEREFMARTTEVNQPWISNSLDDIIAPQNKIQSTFSIPFLSERGLDHFMDPEGYKGVFFTISSATVAVPHNASLAFLIRKIGGGEGDGKLFFFNCVLI